jgi:uncharacterized protein with GYD domain
MPTFLITSNLTEQGSRNVKEVPKRVAASREAAKKFGVEIKQIYMTAGEAEFLVIVESASGDNVAKLCMAIGAEGNARTRTVQAWSEAEYSKLMAELP